MTVRVIPPEFRQLASGTIVSANNSRGKLLLQWTPRDPDGRYQWDSSTRFALAPEEAASVFLARLDPQKLLLMQQQQQQQQQNGSGSDESSDDGIPSTVAVAEIVRRHNPNNPHAEGGFFDDQMPEKVFRARLQGDGSVQLVIDYERDGIGGQESPSPNETTGPLQIDLMMGEYHVLRSIVEYSLPRLIGWSSGLDSLIEQSIEKTTANIGNNNNNNNNSTNFGGRSPHNYQGNDGGGVPF
ncbi:MAG: hypothetical protein SGILL_009409 [Bacillariaceae sp.]